ncbi:hypothetical protein LJR084_002850 [Variovorax sp. LjRoot84]
MSHLYQHLVRYTEQNERETESLWNNEPDVHHSLADAYVRLLRHFDNRMRAVAC